jgi:hypothetical protein
MEKKVAIAGVAGTLLTIALLLLNYYCAHVHKQPMDCIAKRLTSYGVRWCVHEQLLYLPARTLDQLELANLREFKLLCMDGKSEYCKYGAGSCKSASDKFQCTAYGGEGTIFFLGRAQLRTYFNYTTNSFQDCAWSATETFPCSDIPRIVHLVFQDGNTAV